jgi:hypothetical protein
MLLQLIKKFKIMPTKYKMLPIHYRLMLLLFLFFIACKQDDKRMSLTSILNPDEALEDFGQLIEILQSNHPALYDFTAKPSFDSLVELQRTLIKDSLTVSEFFNIAIPVVSQIGCAHTRLRFSDQVWKEAERKNLPFDVILQDGKCFLLKEGAEEIDLKPGTELLSFNDHSIAQLQQKFQQHISTDGDNKNSKELSINNGFKDYLGIIQNFPEQYKVAYKIPGEDSIRHSNIKASSRKSKAHNLAITPQLSIDSVRNLAVMTIPSFNFYDNIKDFQKFVDSSFHRIKVSKLNNLVLDLRNNGGGDPYCSSYLLTYLARQPFIYFEQPAPGYDSLTKYIPLSKERFEGKLYTLINGLCSSTTGHLCALLKYHRIGEFIGSATNGTYTCNDNSRPFTLKHSGLVLVTARTTYSVEVEKIERFKGIAPDHEVAVTLTDYLYGKDPVKEYAFELIHQSNSGQ